MRAASTTTSPSSFNLLLPKHFTALVKLCLHLHSLASPLVPFPLPLQLALVSMFRSRVLSRCVPALPLAIRRHFPQFRPSSVFIDHLSKTDETQGLQAKNGAAEPSCGRKECVARTRQSIAGKVGPEASTRGLFRGPVRAPLISGMIYKLEFFSA